MYILCFRKFSTIPGINASNVVALTFSGFMFRKFRKRKLEEGEKIVNRRFKRRQKQKREEMKKANVNKQVKKAKLQIVPRFAGTDDLLAHLHSLETWTEFRSACTEQVRLLDDIGYGSRRRRKNGGNSNLFFHTSCNHFLF